VKNQSQELQVCASWCLVISVGTPEVGNILPTSFGPNAVRDTPVSARLDRSMRPARGGILNVKVIDPAHGAGAETVTRVAVSRDSKRRSQSPDTRRVSPRFR